MTPPLPILQFSVGILAEPGRDRHSAERAWGARMKTYQIFHSCLGPWTWCDELAELVGNFIMT